jgi:hypothetical protein
LYKKPEKLLKEFKLFISEIPEPLTIHWKSQSNFFFDRAINKYLKLFENCLESLSEPDNDGKPA